MTRGDLVAAEAEEWIGTKFIWQGSQKQVGCDCKGLLWGVARELGFPEAESLYAKVADYSDSKPVPSALMKEGMASIFDPVTELQPGDVLLLKIGFPVPRHAGHFAIVSSDPKRAIHARGSGQREMVKLTRLAALLQVFPLDSAWRWRNG